MSCQARFFTRAGEIDFYTNNTNLCWGVGKNHNMGKDGENEKNGHPKLVELFEL